MLQRWMLSIFSLTWAVVHIHARVFPRSFLELADSSASTTTEPDVDTIAQNIAQSRSPYTSTAKRAVIPIDGASYGSSTGQNQLIGSTNTFEIPNKPLGLAFQPFQQNNPASGAGALDPVTGQNTPVNQPIEFNHVFDSQNVAITQPTGAFLQTTSEKSTADTQLSSQKTQNPSDITAFNDLTTNIPANPPNPSPGGIAPVDLDSYSPSGGSDTTVNNQLVGQAHTFHTLPTGQIGPQVFPYDEDTGEPLHDRIIPNDYDSPNAYTVWEMTYPGMGAGVDQFPHAILVGNGFESRPPYTKYTLQHGDPGEGLEYQKVPNYTFKDKNGQVTTLRVDGGFERRGWLIARDGATKQNALAWFEGIAQSQVPTAIETATWALRVFTALDASVSSGPTPSYWLKYTA